MNVKSELDGSAAGARTPELIGEGAVNRPRQSIGPSALSSIARRIVRSNEGYRRREGAVVNHATGHAAAVAGDLETSAGSKSPCVGRCSQGVAD